MSALAPSESERKLTYDAGFSASSRKDKSFAAVVVLLHVS